MVDDDDARSRTTITAPEIVVVTTAKRKSTQIVLLSISGAITYQQYIRACEVFSSLTIDTSSNIQEVSLVPSISDSDVPAMFYTTASRIALKRVAKGE